MALDDVTSDNFAIPRPSAAGLEPAVLPQRIGHYDIKRIIGSGGMGSVYLAVQENPRRTVALKVMRAEIASRTALRRFEYESQLLGRLKHPGIAQVYEAGTHNSAAGAVPFFAMEYVAGAMTLCDYAHSKRLGARDRLALFVQTCEAMQHAHQRGIIHRDLKPANILVDSTGQPKVIDFGVARGSDADMTGVTLQTNVGQLVGTIQYMSPEQCGADPHNVDVRSDVYSLGVILYELLAGKLPYDVSGHSVHDATRLVCEQLPSRLTTVDRAFGGDVETIVLKALEKDRDKRYQSVADLAADTGRYLRDEPILARPVGPAGRLIRWVRRHREIAVIGSVAALLLFAVSGAALARVVAAKRQAEQSLKAATQNFELVRDMLRFRDSGGETLIKNGEVEIERLLDEAAQSLTNHSFEFPATEADFREILGVSYTALGKFRKAKENLGRTLEIREKSEGGASAGVASALHNLAAAMYNNGEYEQAYANYKRSFSIRRSLHPGDDRDVAFSLTHLAACEAKFGNYETAEAEYKQALEMRRRLHPGDHEDVAASLNNLARLYVVREDYAAAEPLFRQSLEMIRGLKGPRNKLVSNALHNLAGCLLEVGRVSEGKERFAQALDIRKELEKADSLPIASSQLGLAKTELALGNAEEAERLSRDSLRIFRSELRDNHPDTADSLGVLGAVLIAEGKPAAAEPLLREAVEIARNVGRGGTIDLGEKLGQHGACLVALGRMTDAEPLLVESFTSIRAARGDSSRHTAEAANRLAALYRATDRNAKAEEMAAIARAGAPGAGSAEPRR